MSGESALEPAEVVAGIRAVLRRGLPVLDEVPDVLLGLAGVATRAADPDDRGSRIRALDSLLRWQLARLDHPRWASAARLVFGATGEAAGRTLTERRELAAAAASYEVHHFRKRIEPEVCQRLAALLIADSEALRPVAAAPDLFPDAGPLRLPPDVFAWEAADHEAALCGLWARVYLLRAELIGTARAVSMTGPDAPDSTAAAESSLWRLAQLLRAAGQYRAAYGGRLLSPHPPIAPEDLARYAGWHPAVSEQTAAELAELAGPGDDRAAFVAAVRERPSTAAAASVWQTTLIRTEEGSSN